MKHKRWQAVVMIAFAWVLWESVENPKKKAFYFPDPVDGYESLANCRKMQKKKINGMLKVPGYKMETGVHNAVESTKGIILRWQCLPATNVDPRRKK